MTLLANLYIVVMVACAVLVVLNRATVRKMAFALSVGVGITVLYTGLFIATSTGTPMMWGLLLGGGFLLVIEAGITARPLMHAPEGDPRFGSDRHNDDSLQRP